LIYAVGTLTGITPGDCGPWQTQVLTPRPECLCQVTSQVTITVMCRLSSLQ